MNNTPFEQSWDMRGLRLTGRFANYTNADTWYPSWAEDGHLYSSWTDGVVLDSGEYDPAGEAAGGYPCNSLDWDGRKAATAQARIEGDDPLRLRVVNLKPRVEADPAPYGGRYPCGTLVHNGVWYYGTYCLADTSGAALPQWTDMGPCVGFRWTTDFGETWTETPHTPARPLFGEDLRRAKIRLGAPHFVDFGQNMRHAPDGKAYLVGHGAERAEAVNSWVKGDQLYLARVRPSVQTINDMSAYEFFAGYGADGEARWSRRWDDLRPNLEWHDHLGIANMSYNAGLGKYLLFVTDARHSEHYDLLVLEGDTAAGPWRLVTHWERFGPAAYFVNAPTKFMSADGRTFWLLYSANWNDKAARGTPEGSAYSMSWHEVVVE